MAGFDGEFQRALRQELARRVGEFEGYDDRTFGRLSPLELAAAALVTIALPLVVVWWFA